MNRKIVILIVALLAVVGCNDSLRVEHPAKVSGGLQFSVSVPEANQMLTRSFSSEAINSLWVLVFDDQGFFIESQQAEPLEPGTFSTDQNTEYKFSVKLQSSPARRILHLVANYDFEANPVSYGSEYYVLRSLTVADGQDAYWQRVELDHGIPDDISSMPKSDLAKIKKIPLVRNFAKIHVEVAENSNFTMTGYALWNVPDRGCVAPCVMSQNSFAVYEKSDTESDAYALNPWVSRTYAELTKSFDGTSTSGFTGYLPASVNIVQTDASALTFGTDDQYMYERPFSEDNTNTAIIVKGHYSGSSADTYYKIDFVESAAAGLMTYYNIIRNFVYSATIVSCSSDGYATPEEAAEAPAANNFISSVVTQDLINISDGTSRLEISYTDTTVVSTDVFTFRFRYMPDYKNNPTSIDNTRIYTYDRATGQQVGSDGAVIKSYSSDRTTANWCYAYITPQEPSDEEKVQTIVFYEPNESGANVKIARTVNFHLRNPYKMILECSPSTVSSGIGNAVTLNIKVPTGLASHLFPLEFKMEAAANSLTPDVSKSDDTYASGYMSTWYGTSMINSSKRSYGFTKTVTYTEYMNMASTADNSYKIIPCAFKTVKSSSATSVWVYNKYFAFGDGVSTVSFSN